MEWLASNWEMVVGIGSALIVFIGSILVAAKKFAESTKSEKDDEIVAAAQGYFDRLKSTLGRLKTSISSFLGSKK
jgi:hypothetical protein